MGEVENFPFLRSTDLMDPDDLLEASSFAFTACLFVLAVASEPVFVDFIGGDLTSAPSNLSERFAVGDFDGEINSIESVDLLGGESAWETMFSGMLSVREFRC